MHVTADGATARWSARLRELAAEHEIPGASAAVFAGGRLTTLVSGVVNAAAGVETTPEAVFPIGSISKTWTATALMRLADRGGLRIDDAVTKLLPELSLPTRQGDPAITWRHLLSHQSGLDMDHFPDTGRGADALERYVETCARLQRLTAPGVVFSYGNAGFNIAGRAIERVTGQTWDDAMRDLLFEPLGLEHTVTLAEDALMHRAAVGHIDGRPVAPWPVPRSTGPAGGVLASAADLVRFARLHLDGGMTEGGVRLLQEGTVAEMQELAMPLPDPRVAAGWGLGWMLLDWGGERVIGHDGGAVGVASALRMLPSAGTAIAVLTNGAGGADVCAQLAAELMQELHGIAPAPTEPVPAVAPRLDLDRYTGTYRRPAWVLNVRAEDGKLLARLHVEEPIKSEFGTDTLEVELKPIDETRFLERLVRPGGQAADDEGWSPAAFFEVPGHGRFVHMWSRTTPHTEL